VLEHSNYPQRVNVSHMRVLKLHRIIQNFNNIRLSSKIRVDIKLLLESVQKSWNRVG
jgi:hypothetical protein